MSFRKTTLLRVIPILVGPSYLAFYLAIYLTSCILFWQISLTYFLAHVLTLFLALDLAYIPTFFLTYFLTFFLTYKRFLAYLLAVYLAVWHILSNYSGHLFWQTIWPETLSCRHFFCATSFRPGGSGLAIRSALSVHAEIDPLPSQEPPPLCHLAVEAAVLCVLCCCAVLSVCGLHLSSTYSLNLETLTWQVGNHTTTWDNDNSITWV